MIASSLIHIACSLHSTHAHQPTQLNAQSSARTYTHNSYSSAELIWLFYLCIWYAHWSTAHHQLSGRQRVPFEQCNIPYHMMCSCSCSCVCVCVNQIDDRRSNPKMIIIIIINVIVLYVSSLPSSYIHQAEFVELLVSCASPHFIASGNLGIFYHIKLWLLLLLVMERNVIL